MRVFGHAAQDTTILILPLLIADEFTQRINWITNSDARHTQRCSHARHQNRTNRTSVNTAPHGKHVLSCHNSQPPSWGSRGRRFKSGRPDHCLAEGVSDLGPGPLFDLRDGHEASAAPAGSVAALRRIHSRASCVVRAACSQIASRSSTVNWARGWAGELAQSQRARSLGRLRSEASFPPPNHTGPPARPVCRPGRRHSRWLGPACGHPKLKLRPQIV